MKKNEFSEPKLFEFRIRYNAGADHAELDSFHYYNAVDAEHALAFHNAMVEKHNYSMQTVSIEKYNPYSQQWEDESEVLNQSV